MEKIMFRKLLNGKYQLIMSCCLVVLSSGCGEENSVVPKSNRQILAIMGAKGTEAASEQDIQQYKNIFGRLDADGDG